jgi:alpha-mannosidase
MAPHGGDGGRVRPAPASRRDQRLTTHLTVDQRRDWLRTRIGELLLWVDREWVDLTDWTFDGAPLAVGTSWPDRAGVRRLAHPRVRPPWPDGRLELDLGGEGLVTLTYSDGAHERFGLDAEHRSFPLRPAPFAIDVAAVARRPFGAPNRDARLARARITLVDAELERLALRLQLVHEAAEDHDLIDAAAAALAVLRWPSATWPYLSRHAGTPLMRDLWELPAGLDPRPPGLGDDARASVREANAVLDRELAALAGRRPPAGALLLTGHAHLDLAWRWPLDETRRKARRTLWTVVGLLDRHEQLHFNQSTAQLYAYLEDDDPELLARLERHAAAGRFEPIGGMWVEPDCVMPCGESLVRQLLYGQRYFRRRFGAYHTVAWLPDCFGFTAALPQLLAGAGIRRFFTTKLTWSETTRIPHDLFWWEGLDGTRVLAHMFDNPEGGYNGVLGPVAALATWRAFRGRDAHPESLLSVGYGDGGGGPTEEMIARERELRGFPGLPAQRFGRVDEFYARAERADGLPTWAGDLYLELHRGTLTTQGRTKRLHRRAERDLVAAEVVAALAWLAGAEEPASLEPLWRMLLRNQFHDILPGSSIREVYETAERELAAVIAGAGQHIDRALAQLGRAAEGAPLGAAALVVNPDLSARPLQVELAWHLPGAQPVPGGSVLTGARAIAGLEAAVITAGDPAGTLSVSTEHLENDLVRVALAADGSLARVYDKRSGRDVLDGRGNQLWAYVDKPREWDAWEIDATYVEDGAELPAAHTIEVVERGPHRASVRIERAFRDSRIVQHVRLWAGSPRIEFHTRLDWHDRRWLLKARFPTAVRDPRATYETAFGVVERSTRRDTPGEAAQFEVAAHRFADLSEPGFGVALLNDGRYGHHTLGAELGISLLRSPIWPDPLADEGEQEIVYALLPHAGDGSLLAEAEDLNRPLLVRPAGTGAAPGRPLTITGQRAGLGALKPLEDGGGLVLRVYEPFGDRGRVAVEPPPGWALDTELDLLERPAGAPQAELGPVAVRSWALRPTSRPSA